MLRCVRNLRKEMGMLAVDHQRLAGTWLKKASRSVKGASPTCRVTLGQGQTAEPPALLKHRHHAHATFENLYVNQSQQVSCTRSNEKEMPATITSVRRGYGRSGMWRCLLISVRSGHYARNRIFSCTYSTPARYQGNSEQLATSNKNEVTKRPSW